MSKICFKCLFFFFLNFLLLSSIPLFQVLASNIWKETKKEREMRIKQKYRGRGREWSWRLRENQGWQNKRKKAREDETQRSRENDSFYCISILICVHSVGQRGDPMKRWVGGPAAWLSTPVPPREVHIPTPFYSCLMTNDWEHNRREERRRRRSNFEDLSEELEVDLLGESFSHLDFVPARYETILSICLVISVLLFFCFVLFLAHFPYGDWMTWTQGSLCDNVLEINHLTQQYFTSCFRKC